MSATEPPIPRGNRWFWQVSRILGLVLAMSWNEAFGQDRWWLMRHLQGSFLGWQLDSRGIDVLGWTESSYTASSASDVNLPVGLNYLANEFALQQNWLRMDRAVDTEGGAFAWGFRNDWILPGTDYRFTLPRGLWNGQLTSNDGEPAFYGIDPVQFYAEFYVPGVAQGTSVKVGRFLLPYGVETTEAITTPLISRSYLFFYNPFTQFGAIATTKVNDCWSVVAGVSAGSDVLVDPANEPTFDVGVKWTAPDGIQSFNVFAVLGESRFDAEESFNHPSILDFVYTRSLTSRLNYSGELLVGYQRDVPDLGTATWQGTAHYLAYRCTERLTSNTRFEFFHDQVGNRTGFEGVYTSLTGGFAMQATRAIAIRPELRCDYNGESRPFEGEHVLVTAAADVILRW